MARFAFEALGIELTEGQPDTRQTKANGKKARNERSTMTNPLLDELAQAHEARRRAETRLADCQRQLVDTRRELEELLRRYRPAA